MVALALCENPLNLVIFLAKGEVQKPHGVSIGLSLDVWGPQCSERREEEEGRILLR